MNIKLQSIARRKAGDKVSEELFAGEVSVSEGLHGDKSARSALGEVALLSKESWVKVCHESGKDLPWLMHDSNLLIKGFEFLPTDLGKNIHIGDATFQIIRELAPNHELENQSSELFEALLPGWRSGVICKVVLGGNIQSGDEVIIDG